MNATISRHEELSAAYRAAYGQSGGPDFDLVCLSDWDGVPADEAVAEIAEAARMQRAGAGDVAPVPS